MNPTIALIALSLGQFGQEPLAPSDSVLAAHTDIVKVQGGQEHIRYLSLYNIPTTEREQFIRALNGHCNCLSRSVDLKPVQIVPGTGGSLVRVNLLDYQWGPSVWEKLLDPYFTATVETKVETYWEGGVWPDDGRNYPANSFKYNKRVKSQVAAPWLAETLEQKKQLSDLMYMTKSQVPIVRADWFIYQVAVQENRQVGYYDFLGIKNQKDFERVIRFSAELSKQLEHRRAVVFSGITLQPRRIERVATVMGGLWRTFDNEAAAANRNPLRILDDDFKFDATEQIGPLPNGMPAYYLGDDKGNRQDKAPDKVVGGDRTGTSNDTRLHVCLSCVRCHFGAAKHEMGVKEGDFAKITKLKSIDYQKYLDINRQYLRDVDRPIKKDREDFQAAIKQATGLEPFAYAAEFAKIYQAYEGPVTAERAAADLGITKAAMIKAFREYDARYDLDPVLSILMDGKSIGPVQWEEVVPSAHLAIRGLVQK